MERIFYDLHIHTCLSPCASDDMTPANIIGMASLKGLQVIAITDHNSCKNCEVAMKHGKAYKITVIPGMELTTKEEVHVLLLFRSIESANRMDQYVYENLVKRKNEPRFFGNQQMIGMDDEIIGQEPNLLLEATSIPFDEVSSLAKYMQAVMIPAHIDKATNSLLSNLGFINEESKFHTFEVAKKSKIKLLREQHPYLCGCNYIVNSDAHQLGDISEPNEFIEAVGSSIDEILHVFELSI